MLGVLASLVVERLGSHGWLCGFLISFQLGVLGEFWGCWLVPFYLDEKHMLQCSAAAAGSLGNGGHMYPDEIALQ